MDDSVNEQLKRELPFDLYGRYAMVREIVSANRNEGETFRILDVGGRGNLLKRFLQDDDVFYLDPFVESDDSNFIKGDGCLMPLEDDSFDWVTSVDVFEHVPKEKRSAFLDENIRVARLGVVLAAPFGFVGVADAEMNANETYRMAHGGADHPWLKEHIENGLPDPLEFEALLSKKGRVFQRLHNNQLFLWQGLIGFDFLSECQDSEIISMKERYNYYFNTKIFPHDHQQPSYRSIYFIKKDIKLADFRVGSGMGDALFLEALQKGFEPTRALFQKNKDVLEQTTRQMREISGELHEKNAELAFMRSSKYWKLRTFCEGFKRVLTSPADRLIRRSVKK